MLKKGSIRTKFFKHMISMEILPLLVIVVFFCVHYTRYYVDKHLNTMKRTLEQDAYQLNMSLQKEVVRCGIIIKNDVLYANLNRDFDRDLEKRLQFKQQIYTVWAMIESYGYENNVEYLIYTDNYDLIVNDHMVKLDEIKDKSIFPKIMQAKVQECTWEIQMQNDAVNLVIYLRFPTYSGYTNILKCTIPFSPGLTDFMNEETLSNGGYFYYNESDYVLYSEREDVEAGDIFIEKDFDHVYFFEETLLNGHKLALLVPKQIWWEYGIRVCAVAGGIFAALLLIILINIFIVSHSMTEEIEDFTGKITENPMEYLDYRDTARYESLEMNLIEKSFLKVLTELNKLHEDILEKERRNSSLELELLQAQINPHLIYNTLSTIKWGLLEREEYKDAQLVDSLTQYYRLTLNKGSNIVRLDQEIEMIRLYLQLIEQSKSIRIESEIVIPQEIEKCAIYKHLLQPFVENAVLHGFDMQSDKPKSIRIYAACEDEKIHISIEDNGLGILPETAKKLEDGSYRSQYGGYGIRNVMERLKNSYGKEYEVKISGEPNVGTRVSIRYPIMVPEEKGTVKS